MIKRLKKKHTLEPPRSSETARQVNRNAHAPGRADGEAKWRAAPRRRAPGASCRGVLVGTAALGKASKIPNVPRGLGLSGSARELPTSRESPGWFQCLVLGQDSELGSK